MILYALALLLQLIKYSWLAIGHHLQRCLGHILAGYSKSG